VYPESVSTQADVAAASGLTVEFDFAEATPNLSQIRTDQQPERSEAARHGHFIDHALELFDKGYKPVLLPMRSKGPVEREWQITAPRRTRDDVEAMVRHASPSAGVGIFAQNAQLLDADIYDHGAALAVEQLANERLVHDQGSCCASGGRSWHW
jgi:hypothetical protein